MIYCVVPEALAGELFDKLSDYYAEDSGVTVIVERRRGSRRAPGVDGRASDDTRIVRDRRRPRVVGELLDVSVGG